MRIKKTLLVLFISSFLGFSFVSAKVKLPSIISDHMVLQQEAETLLWGWTDKNTPVKITTSWNGKTYDVRANEDMRWEVFVSTPEHGGPFEITFDDGEKQVLKDIWIGEVWICSGQSNMEMPMIGFPNNPILHSNEILLDAKNDQIRLFNVKNKASEKPLEDVEGEWNLSSSKTAGNFSAIGFQFAQRLQKLLDVPVGIIESDWGGTPIMAWMSKESLSSFPKIPIPGEDKWEAVRASHLFNGMIYPIAGYSAKGFLWYQGESDAFFDPYLYKELMVGMVADWRARWQNQAMPFYYVQIAPHDYGELRDSVPLIREAQEQAMTAIPHSGMAVTMDVGEKHNIHPADKSTVANRLLYWALGDTYDWDGIAYKSPTYESMTIRNDTITVTLKDADMGTYSSSKEEISGFEVAGEDRLFHPAKATLRGQKIEVKSEQVSAPIAVRYLFKDFDEGHIYNNRGLPLAPFRTDSW